MLSRRHALLAGAASPLAAAAASAPAAAAERITAAGAEPLTTPPESRARTTLGEIQGFRRGPVYTFKGVPYGAEPTGPLRFMPPKPAAAWTGVRKTLTFGPTAWQPVRDRNNPDLAFVNDWDDGYPGEDCLCLNVWTTSMDRNARRPVMVWLHGGGYTTGSSQEFPSYDGGGLAKRGVVLVSVNHRLGALGFLDLSSVLGGDYAASGNVGMMDIVLALEWVRDNIATFGGDPSRVTIFGQSGGGGKVSTLMGMPSARGLFHRAIVMSGSFAPTRSPQAAAGLARATLDELGAADAAALQQVEPMRLIQAGQAAIARLRGDALSWGPVLDGRVVAEGWDAAAPAMSAAVPMMIGSTRDEFRRWGANPTLAELPGYVPAALAGRAPQIVEALRKDFPAARPIDLGGYITGMSWRNNAVAQATKKQAQGAAPVYSYWFTYVGAPFDGALGAPHCADIHYAFDNVAVADQLTGNTPEAQAVADKVSQAFVNFAASGNPAAPGLAWPAFDPVRVQTMVFDARPHVADDPAGDVRRMMA